MSTYRQLTFLVLDEAKGLSDDFTYTEEHIMFILDKYRAFLLKQRYADIKKHMPANNYQTLSLDLIEVPAIAGEVSEGGTYLKSTVKIPFLLEVGNPKVTSVDYFQGEFHLISRDRMRYVGHNKFLQNVVYSSIGPDEYLYFKSSNALFLTIEHVKITGVFQDAMTASDLTDDAVVNLDVLDRRFPIEEGLIPPLIELTLKELLGAAYRPKDDDNNADDDLSKLTTSNKK